MRQGHSILMIDSNEFTAFLSDRVLMHSDLVKQHEVYVTATQGINRLMECQSKQPVEFPDVVLIDEDLPEMKGWRLLDDFQAQLPKRGDFHPAIFVLTGDNFNPLENKAKARAHTGVLGTLSKPLTLEALWEVHFKSN